MKDEIMALLYECIEELNEQFPEEQRLAKSPQTELLGRTSGLDSLGFVNFIALAEEKCEERFNVALMLSDAANEDGEGTLGTLDELAEVIVRAVSRKV
jgi:hypothetical protein